MCYEIVFWIFLLSKPIRLRGLKSPDSGRNNLGYPSKPIRLRGLKYMNGFFRHMAHSRSLYGFVDWNHKRKTVAFCVPVEAYTASWIEMCLVINTRHGNYVEAYTASWIEIDNLKANSGGWRTSKPIRLRGLKFLVDRSI